MNAGMIFAILLCVLSALTQQTHTEAVLSFFGQNLHRLSEEEAVCFYCIAILDDKTELTKNYATNLSSEKRDAFYREIIWMGASCDDRRIIEAALNDDFEKPERVVWAIDCTSAAHDYDYAIEILNRRITKPDLYRLHGERILIAAALAGELDLVDLSNLKLDSSIAQKISTDESLIKRHADSKDYRRTSVSTGMTRTWSEKLIAHKLESHTIPDSDESLEAELDNVASSSGKMSLLFLYTASLANRRDMDSARRYFVRMQDLYDSDDRVGKAFIGEMSFIASKLRDLDFLRRRLDGLQIDPKDRKRLHYVLAAATECNMDKEILEFLSTIGSPTTMEINAVADFGVLTEDERWEELDSSIRMRIVARQIWQSRLSERVK